MTQHQPLDFFLPPQPGGGFPSAKHVSMASFANRPEASMVTASQQTGATPAGEFFWRAPSPPHIHIPPTPEDQPILLPHAEIFIGDQANNEVLKIITNGYYAPRPTEWRYEWRRQAQRILSFLYLGPSSASKNVEFLKQEGITMLLCIRDSKSASANFLSGEKVAKQLGIEASHVDVTDNQDLTHRLRDAVLIINDHLISQFQKRRVSHREEDLRGKVLVFCESGNERSATVAVAYLLAMFEVDLVGAIQYIQGQRFCVAFDDNLKNLLMSFQQMVEAEKMTLGARRQIQAPTHKTPAKRSRSDMDADEYMDVYQADDEARFDGRRVFAPFMDSRNQTMNIME